MIVAVVLGNRLNDDGSITDKMRCRIELASEIHKTLLPCKMVLSGGVANPAVSYTHLTLPTKA